MSHKATKNNKMHQFRSYYHHFEEIYGIKNKVNVDSNEHSTVLNATDFPKTNPLSLSTKYYYKTVYKKTKVRYIVDPSVTSKKQKKKIFNTV